MKIKWQWFLGGRSMFWVSIILFAFLIATFIFTYLLDMVTLVDMKVQNIETEPIKKISNEYIKKYNINIDKDIVYRFVHYRYNDSAEDDILLGTFHEWNNTYYIDISSDLYNMNMLNEIVIHETRHMIVEYLRDREIIDLTDYTEEIASEKNDYYNKLFECGVYLLNNKAFDGDS